MAPYQKPTVEEVEDEARRHKEAGIRIQILGSHAGPGVVPTATTTPPPPPSSSAAQEAARRLRKRKCAWEGAPRPFIPTVCR